MQQSLFENEDFQPIRKNSLIISKKKQQPLNKKQIAFNNLVKKIEKLRDELKNTSDDLDQKLAYYGKELHPLEVQINLKRKEILRALFSQFKSNKKIKGAHKKSLKAVLLSFIHNIFSAEDKTPEKDLQDIYHAVSGEKYEDLVKVDSDLMKEDLAQMFEDSGVDYNPEELKKDMTLEEILAKMNELSEKIRERVEIERPKKPERKKTARQVEKEQKNKQLEEARTKNIKSIYKQLVKALHPDLELDETAKLQKVILMQRLTVAYQNNDLHAMLSLEMEWINKEENNIDELSTEKLAIYNQVLKDQIQSLEQQKYMLLQHPRFLPLFKYMDLYNRKSNRLNQEKKNLEITIESMDTTLKNLNGQFALKEINEIVKEFVVSQEKMKYQGNGFFSWLAGEEDWENDFWE